MEKDKFILILTFAILLILVGTKLNFTVMIKNEGRMPLQWDFYSTEIEEYVLWNEKSQVELWWLGDNFRLWMLAFSIGDIIILVGILLAIAVNIKTFVKRGN